MLNSVRLFTGKAYYVKVLLFVAGDGRVHMHMLWWVSHFASKLCAVFQLTCAYKYYMLMRRGEEADNHGQIGIYIHDWVRFIFRKQLCRVVIRHIN